MRRVRRAHGASKILGAEHVKMFGDRHHTSLHVELLRRSRLVTASDDPKGLILDNLELVDGRCRGVRRPDSSAEIERRRDVGLEGLQEDLLAAPPGSASKSTERVKLRGAGLGYNIGVGVKVKMRVEMYTEETRIFVELKRRPVNIDVRLRPRFTTFVRREEGD